MGLADHPKASSAVLYQEQPHNRETAAWIYECRGCGPWCRLLGFGDTKIYLYLTILEGERRQLEENSKKIPLLHDYSGPIYNPRKALMLFDLLTTGKNKASDFLKDDRLMRTIRRALVAQYPAEPNFQKGIHGKKFNRYSCQNCGFGVSEASYNYCPSCGQALTEAYCGGRKTQEEEEKYWEA